MITIKEISQKRNIPVETLYRRLKRFNIEPRTKKGITNYYNNNVDVLIGQKPPRFFPTQLKKIKSFTGLGSVLLVVHSIAS